MTKLIDVSHHQGAINWEQVKGNADGAILRCGYGQDIEKQDDKQFKRNADECTRLGIPFGVYLYSYAKSAEAAQGEAAHVLRLIEGYTLSFPVYIDLEENGCEAYAKEVAEAFAAVIESAGHWCGVYANTYWWDNYLNGVTRFTKWVARYKASECGVEGTDIWQYSSEGSVPGISGKVDMNDCYRDFAADMNAPDASMEEGKPEYVVGQVYTLREEMKVRTGAGTNYRAKTCKELTADGRRHDADGDGALEKGTKVTCKEVEQSGNDIWMRTPSGWIAAYYQGKQYIK